MVHSWCPGIFSYLELLAHPHWPIARPILERRYAGDWHQDPYTIWIFRYDLGTANSNMENDNHLQDNHLFGVCQLVTVQYSSTKFSLCLHAFSATLWEDSMTSRKVTFKQSEMLSVIAYDSWSWTKIWGPTNIWLHVLLTNSCGHFCGPFFAFFSRFWSLYSEDRSWDQNTFCSCFRSKKTTGQCWYNSWNPENWNYHTIMTSCWYILPIIVW